MTRLKDICDIKGFGYDPMCEIQLTNPYIFIPHPFKKGDIAYYYYDDKRYYGVVSHPCTEELSREREERGISCDGSDFLAVIETADKKEDGSFTMGFSHICPLYMEKYNEEIKYEQGNELSVLAFASEIITGKSSSLSSLMYFMKQ